MRQPNISVATNSGAMEDDIIYEKAVEILNPGRLYFALKAMRNSPVKISFDMGDLNLNIGSRLFSGEHRREIIGRSTVYAVACAPGGSEDIAGFDPA